MAWDDLEGAPSIFSVTGVSASQDARSVCESCPGSVNRFILRDGVRFDFLQNKLSAAMIGAFQAMCGRVGAAVETRYAQWQQYAVCAVDAIARRSRVVPAKHWEVAPIRSVRRVKAFFVFQRINGRNAP